MFDDRPWMMIMLDEDEDEDDGVDEGVSGGETKTNEKHLLYWCQTLKKVNKGKQIQIGNVFTDSAESA